MCLLRVPLRAFSARDCVRVRAMGVLLGGRCSPMVIYILAVYFIEAVNDTTSIPMSLCRIYIVDVLVLLIFDIKILVV